MGANDVKYKQGKIVIVCDREKYPDSCGKAKAGIWCINGMNGHICRDLLIGFED